MNKFNYIIISLLLLAFTSCNTNEKDIFLDSSATRLNQALEDDFSALTNAENGWVMEYFATSGSPGYVLLVKFNKNGNAIFSAKSELTLNKEIETDSSLFEMIGDNGPVLSFNTYNKVLHKFSTPENPDGYGLEGDYEFIVMNVSDDLIELRGKKRNTVILLKKIPVGITWNQYIAEIDGMKELLFSRNAPKLSLKIGTKSYTFSNGYTQIFNVVNEGSGESINLDMPFIYTRTGLRLYDNLVIGDLKFMEFKLSDDKSSLLSVENSDYKLVGAEDLAVYFVSNILVWNFNAEKLSPEAKTYYDQIVESCKTNYNAENVQLALRYYATRKSFELTLSFVANHVPTEGNLDLSLTVSGVNSATLFYKGTGDAKGKSYYTEIAGLSEMVSFISSSYSLSTTSTLNPQEIRFTKKTNSSAYFYVNQQ